MTRRRSRATQPALQAGAVGPGAAVGTEAAVEAESIAGRDVMRAGRDLVFGQLYARDPLLAEALAYMQQRFDHAMDRIDEAVRQWTYTAQMLNAQDRYLRELEERQARTERMVVGNGEQGLDEQVRGVQSEVGDVKAELCNLARAGEEQNRQIGGLRRTFVAMFVGLIIALVVATPFVVVLTVLALKGVGWL